MTVVYCLLAVSVYTVCSPCVFFSFLKRVNGRVIPQPIISEMDMYRVALVAFIKKMDPLVFHWIGPLFIFITRLIKAFDEILLHVLVLFQLRGGTFYFTLKIQLKRRLQGCKRGS